MTDVAIPGSPRWREEDRLAALDAYGVLDTPPESDFDDIVRIAAQICDVPMAAISLVDSGRQWFKAALGVDAAETPRDIAFCAHAIQQTDVMVVEDAAADARFKANPLVTGEMQLRFYAGALLETPDGLPLGTLCVLDRKPRELTAAQQSALRALARQVTAQLELRKALARQSAIEADRRLLAAELEHRVKNTLAMVQAIVSQSLRIAATPAEASRTIEQRLIALARANDILIRTNWAAAPISTIVAAATDIHGAQPHRIIATGPEIKVSSRAAVGVALALHELCTNAAKYGALSNSAGRVLIEWSISGAGEAAMFELTWREEGGPPVVAPTRKGFGTKLIQASLSGGVAGKSTIEYNSDGVVFHASALLSSICEE